MAPAIDRFEKFARPAHGKRLTRRFACHALRPVATVPRRLTGSRSVTPLDRRDRSDWVVTRCSLTPPPLRQAAPGDRHCDELVEGSPSVFSSAAYTSSRFTPGAHAFSFSFFLTEDTFTPPTARGEGAPRPPAAPRSRRRASRPAHQVGAVLLVGVGQHSRVMPAQLGGRGGPRESAQWTWSESPAQSSPSAHARCCHGADVGLHPTGADRVAAAPSARWAQAIYRVSRSARAGHRRGHPPPRRPPTRRAHCGPGSCSPRAGARRWRRSPSACGGWHLGRSEDHLGGRRHRWAPSLGGPCPMPRRG
jgi:hypothetical protein